jgi:hypothetical protein
MARLSLAAVAAVAACAAAGAAAARLRPATAAAAAAFDAWAAAHGKTYSPEERALRAAVFARNYADIVAHNAGGHTWTKAVNKWSDLTGPEWRAQVLAGGKAGRRASAGAGAGAVPPPDADAQLASLLARLPSSAIPASVNWTAAGAVTPVKDQGQCGSCWAFATVGAIEGAYAVANGTLLSLSEQQVVSCDRANGNDGCNGGEQITALDWVAKQPGICSEAGYPYTSGGGKTGSCRAGCTPVVKIAKGVELAARNETLLMAAIAASPLSLSVDASNDAIWQSYSGGVVTSACKCDGDACLDHGVTGVGYGVDASGGAYWTIKNSWGTDWGEAGYIRLGRGAAYGPGGQCGVQIDNAYAVI